jgi:hypothetical protein
MLQKRKKKGNHPSPEDTLINSNLLGGSESCVANYRGNTWGQEFILV